MHNLLKVIHLAKNSFFQLAICLLAVGLIYNFAKTNESDLMRAQRLDFPGTTELTLNRSFQRLQLTKEVSKIDQKLNENLSERNLKIVSPIYKDQKKNIRVTVTQSEDDQLLFTVIKNNQITQVQRINDIDQRKITLQYGTIQLNSNKLADASESGEVL